MHDGLDKVGFLELDQGWSSGSIIGYLGLLDSYGH